MKRLIRNWMKDNDKVPIEQFNKVKEDPCVKFWIEWHRNDEFLRATGDTILGIKPPNDFYSKVFDTSSWDPFTRYWYYNYFHTPGIYRRHLFLEKWANNETLGKNSYLANLSQEDWNRLVPDELKILDENIIMTTENTKSELTLDRINYLLLKSSEGVLKEENMTFFEKYITYNKYIGIPFNELKMAISFWLDNFLLMDLLEKTNSWYKFWFTIYDRNIKLLEKIISTFKEMNIIEVYDLYGGFGVSKLILSCFWIFFLSIVFFLFVAAFSYFFFLFFSFFLLKIKNKFFFVFKTKKKK